MTSLACADQGILLFSNRNMDMIGYCSSSWFEIDARKHTTSDVVSDVATSDALICRRIVE